MKHLLFILFACISFAASAQSKKDTLVIPPHVKVIVIDGQEFEVVRKVELKKAESIQFGLHRGFGWGGGSVTPAIVDSSYYHRFILPNYYNNGKPLTQ